MFTFTKCRTGSDCILDYFVCAMRLWVHEILNGMLSIFYLFCICNNQHIQVLCEHQIQAWSAVWICATWIYLPQHHMGPKLVLARSISQSSLSFFHMPPHSLRVTWVIIVHTQKVKVPVSCSLLSKVLLLATFLFSWSWLERCFFQTFFLHHCHMI